MMRWLRWALVVMVAGSAACYACDWAVFRLRGLPSSKVTVSYFVSAPLKNDKQELDYLGSEEVSCSIALFPQAGQAPCWYLRRHTNQVTSI